MLPDDLSLNPLLFFALALVGFAWLWATRLIFVSRERRQADAYATSQIAGWITVIAGVVVGVALTMHVFSFFLGPVGIVILIATWMRFRLTERRAFQLVLASALRHQLPLPQVARAFAAGRYDSTARRARLFAARIEQGASVSQAARESRLAGDLDSQLGLLAGERLGLLDRGVLAAAEAGDESRDDLRTVMEKLWYLVALSFVMLGILTFVMLKIVPVFKKMFEEFRLELPGPTLLLIAVSESVVKYWFVLGPVYLLAAALLLAGTLAYIGWLPINVPLFGWLTRSLDAARVMRWLALGIRGGRDVTTTLGVLAETYPRYSVAWQLREAARLTANGMPWHEALQANGLLKSAEVAVLRAAERTGDLAWTLEELAASRLRRQSLRIRGVWNLLFPALLLGYAAVVAFVFIALFMPLVKMITGLSGT